MKASPIVGRATFATVRLRFATAATRMSASRTRAPFAGAADGMAAGIPAEGVVVAAVMPFLFAPSARGLRPDAMVRGRTDRAAMVRG